MKAVLDHVGIAVERLDEALAFYRDALGLEVTVPEEVPTQRVRAHMLDTGNGFLLHGTPHKTTIGTAATHGCIRLRDDDIEWLYDMLPVGTKIYIY